MRTAALSLIAAALCACATTQQPEHEVVAFNAAPVALVHNGATGALGSADALALVYGSPLAKADDVEVKSGDSAVSAIAWEEFPPTDITPSYLRGANHVQILTVTNDHATAKICVAYTDRGAASDCSTLAAGLSETCTDGHSAADADYVLPGAQRSFPIRGDQCVFYRATAAATGHFSLVVR